MCGGLRERVLEEEEEGDCRGGTRMGVHTPKQIEVPLLFSKATDTILRVFMGDSPVQGEEVVYIHY